MSNRYKRLITYYLGVFGNNIAQNVIENIIQRVIMHAKVAKRKRYETQVVSHWRIKDLGVFAVGKGAHTALQVEVPEKKNRGTVYQQ